MKLEEIYLVVYYIKLTIEPKFLSPFMRLPHYTRQIG